MATGARDRLHQEIPDLGAQPVHLGVVEPFQVGRAVHALDDTHGSILRAQRRDGTHRRGRHRVPASASRTNSTCRADSVTTAACASMAANRSPIRSGAPRRPVHWDRAVRLAQTGELGGQVIGDQQPQPRGNWRNTGWARHSPGHDPAASR